MEDLLNTKAQAITDRFRGIQHGVSDIVLNLKTFLSEVDPHIRYFFSDMKASDGFYSEVILPSEKDMKDAMNKAVSNMNGDVSAHNRSREALIKTMELSDGVSKIVELLEYIEIFSLNTMVISAKAGTVGQALSTISVEMTRLSRLGSELSEEITGKMISLEKSIEGFDNLKEQIEFLHENNLTKITITSSSIFSSLETHIQTISGEVIDNYSMISTVTKSLESVFEKFQYEDIVRQGFEKVLFARECYTSEKDTLISKSDIPDQKTIREVFGSLSRLKLDDIVNDITLLFDELTNAFNKVLQGLDTFTASLDTLKSGKDNSTGADNSIEAVNIRLSELRKSYDSYIHDIFLKKEEMLTYLIKAYTELNEFSRFFDKMLEISHKFKTIILLTHIEIARHQELNTLLSGSLNDVRSIPLQINIVVEQISSRYNSIRDSLSNAISDYKKMFAEQKIILNKSVALMELIIHKMDDSGKRHITFLDGSKNNVTGLKDFIHTSNDHAEEAKLLAHGLANYEIPGINSGIDKNAVIGTYADSIPALLDNLTEAEGTEQYQLMMLVSLIREYFGNDVNKAKIELF